MNWRRSQWKEHEGRCPLHSCNAYKVQKSSGTDKLVAEWDTVPVLLQKFSRCASMSASPTVGDVKALNKLARQLKSQPVKLHFWPLTGPLSIIGFPDASYRNNDDGSSQRGMTVFLAESRETVLSTTVAELYSFMKCLGLCPFLRGSWMDIAGEGANIHMRIYAKNVVTTARTIHLPERWKPST